MGQQFVRINIDRSNIMKILILAGGSGTRLWPLSRERYPKQFIKLQGKQESLFQETFKRSILLSNINDIYVVTNEKYKFFDFRKFRRSQLQREQDCPAHLTA